MNKHLTTEELKAITISKGDEDFGLFVKNENVKVNSRTVAAVFKKQHAHIIRSIETQILPHISEEFSQSNFGLAKYKDKQGKIRKSYDMTFDGFIFLVSGFTGKQVAKLKEGYITAWRQMFDLVNTRQDSKQGYKKMASNVKRYHLDYPSEADLVNRIILGMSSHRYKIHHNLRSNDSIRDHLGKETLTKLDEAQRLNAQLMDADLSYGQRYDIISKSLWREANN